MKRKCEKCNELNTTKNIDRVDQAHEPHIVYKKEINKSRGRSLITGFKNLNTFYTRFVTRNTLIELSS